MCHARYNSISAGAVIRYIALDTDSKATRFNYGIDLNIRILAHL